MKCTNCGNNNAAFHFTQTINGVTTEMHLCPECAAPVKDELMGSFNMGFGSSLFNSPFFGDIPGLFDMVMPRFSARTLPHRSETVSPDRGENFSVGTDPELTRRRTINQLKAELQSAVDAEDYEKAKELAEKLKEMEK